MFPDIHNAFLLPVNVPLKDIGELCGGKFNRFGKCKGDLFCKSKGIYFDSSIGYCTPKKCEEDAELCKALEGLGYIPPRKACGQGERKCAKKSVKYTCPKSCDVCDFDPSRGPCEGGGGSVCAVDEGVQDFDV